MKTQKHSLLSALFVIAAFSPACASKNPGTASAPKKSEPGSAKGSSGPSPDLEALLQREATGLKPVKTRLADGAATVLASAPPVLGQKDGTPKLDISIGTQTAVQCFLYKEELIAGAQLSSVLGALSAAPGLEIIRVAPWNVAVAQDVPALFVEVQYLANGKNGKLLGQLKFAIHPHSTQPAMCLHDEVGYRGTFEKVVQSLIESRSSTTPAKAAQFVEISRVSVGQQPVGFESTTLITANGKRLLRSVSTLLVPRSETELLIEDRASHETVDAKGHLEEGRWVTALGGKLGMRVQVKRLNKGVAYSYDGEMQGKNVHGEFKVRDKAGLGTAISTAGKLKELLKKGAPFDFTQEEYTPGADPSKPVDVRYSRAKEAQPGLIRITMGDMDANATLADNGRPERLIVPMGGAELVIERVHHKGKL